MPWVKIKGIDGLIYAPEKQPRCERKHQCRDCYYCQMCSDVRCDACRKEKAAAYRAKRKERLATEAQRAQRLKNKKL